MRITQKYSNQLRFQITQKVRNNYLMKDSLIISTLQIINETRQRLKNKIIVEIQLRNYFVLYIQTDEDDYKVKKIYVYIYTHTKDIYAYIYTYTYRCIHIYTYLHTHIVTIFFIYCIHFRAMTMSRNSKKDKGWGDHYHSLQTQNQSYTKIYVMNFQNKHRLLKYTKICYKN